jgi:DNA-binding NtrC family response regulator
MTANARAYIEAIHAPKACRPRPKTWAETKEEARRLYFDRVLTECNGNVTEAARVAGISRVAMSKIKSHYGLRGGR